MESWSTKVLMLYIAFFSELYEGADILTGGMEGIPCFSPRKITGCDGTLLEQFRPTVPYADTNRPNTRILLFTPKNPTVGEYLHECGGRLPNNTFFNPNLKTKIIIHGWLDGTCKTVWMREIRDQFFIRGDYNMILIDWSWGNTPDHAAAASNNRVVAEQIAFVIKNIMKQTGAKAKDFHIIGHSFGAHIGGFVGKRVSDLGRITGLDPALAPYKFSGPKDRLNQTDAELVDNIHSSASNCSIAVQFGYDGPLGHADFYPNGGSIQKSCQLYVLISLIKMDFMYALISSIPSFCNHLQSIQYFKASINPCNCHFVGVECRSYEDFTKGKCRSCGPDGSKCAVMGYDFEKYNMEKDGQDHSYYLDTSLLCPYCNNSGINFQGFKLNNQATKYCRTTANNNPGSSKQGTSIQSLFYPNA